ncbi:MAG: bifunctional DNA primase/polymerase, partial [Planctomycetaceae bacterium]|nr:bifunctional DNA primase/polymerase [Planctomycetaceae bacterium]
MKHIGLEYLRQGLSVIPAKRLEKRPTLSGWKEYQRRLPTVQEWEHWTSDAICIVCGVVSGNLLMIDFDQQGKAFEDFKRECPPEILSLCVIERSQSGGFHIIVRCDQPIGKNHVLARDAEKKVLIETRGEGGLFLCAPTPGYELTQGSFTSIPVLKKHQIDLLLESARQLDQTKLKEETPHSQQTTSPSGIRPGDDLNERGRELLRATLARHGWVFTGQKDGNEEWRRPGKDFGVSATLHTDMPVFYVFTTSMPPFEQRGYSFFDTYAILEHGGDHSAAAKALAGFGFGETFGEVKLPEFIMRPPGGPSPEIVKDSAPKTKNPGKFPEHLLNVPGYVNTLSKFINETSFVRQPIIALASSLAFQAMLCAQQLKCPLGTRPNINIIATGKSCSGKERGRHVIKEILVALANRPEKTYDPYRHFLEDTASYQGLVRKLEAGGGILLWLWDEVGKVLPSLRQDRTSHLSGILPIIMRLYTSANSVFSPHTRADAANTIPTIQQPHLVIFGTSVPRNVLEGFSIESLTDGLMGRLLFFEGDDEEDDTDIEAIPPVSEEILEIAHWWMSERK